MSRVNSYIADADALAQLLSRFASVRLAVVGDYFLDRYLVLDPQLAEPSLETGLIAQQVVAIRNSPGAAGTVINNLVALGAGTLHAVGIIGDDAYGYELRRELVRRGVAVDHLFAAAERFTPTYTKPMVREPGGERELGRFDIINRTPTPAELEDRIVASVNQLVNDVDGVIVLDQVASPDVGVITNKVRDKLAAIARRYPEKLFYADSRIHIGLFRDMVIKANHFEALRTVGRDPSQADTSTLEAVGRELLSRSGRPVLITRGENGMLVTTAKSQTHVPGCPVTGPIDVTGAGDSATAAITLARCAGADWPAAAFLGNLVASITILQLGTTGTASPAQVLERFERMPNP